MNERSNEQLGYKELIVPFALFFILINNIVVADTINVVFIGIKKGETYKIVHQNKATQIITCKRNNECKREFTIVDTTLKENNLVSLTIYRKGRWSVIYRNTSFHVIYKRGMKYLIIYRYYKYKNKYAIYGEWTNEMPIRE